MTGPDPEREASSRGAGRAYQGAFEAVMALLVAAGAGAFADSHLGTGPLLLLLGVLLGFGAFVMRLVRLLGAPGPPAGDEADEERGK
ncbi:MAG: AtpZ/AtpI family protein [Proteobacteria bacterium]|nr:AtpZ/AtpI family protein [Pseudomonadota bacterium]